MKEIIINQSDEVEQHIQNNQSNPNAASMTVQNIQLKIQNNYFVKNKKKIEKFSQIKIDKRVREKIQEYMPINSRPLYSKFMEQQIYKRRKEKAEASYFYSNATYFQEIYEGARNEHEYEDFNQSKKLKVPEFESVGNLTEEDLEKIQNILTEQKMKTPFQTPSFLNALKDFSQNRKEEQRQTERDEIKRAIKQKRRKLLTQSRIEKRLKITENFLQKVKEENNYIRQVVRELDLHEYFLEALDNVVSSLNDQKN